MKATLDVDVDAEVETDDARQPKMPRDFLHYVPLPFSITVPASQYVNIDTVGGPARGNVWHVLRVTANIASLDTVPTAGKLFFWLFETPYINTVAPDPSQALFANGTTWPVQSRFTRGDCIVYPGSQLWAVVSNADTVAYQVNGQIQVVEMSLRRFIDERKYDDDGNVISSTG